MRVSLGKSGSLTIYDFSPVQAYKIAINLEKTSIQFYKDLLKQIKVGATKREINFLIEQEATHLGLFQGLLDKEKEVSEDPFEEDDIVKYMNTHVFSLYPEEEKAKKMEHRHTALEEAMHMEKRSIIFYEGCLAQTKTPQARQAFTKILEEEKRHLAKFAELLRIKCINSSEGCLL